MSLDSGATVEDRVTPLRLSGTESVQAAYRLSDKVKNTLQQVQSEVGGDAKHKALSASGPPLSTTGRATNKGLRHFSKQVVDKLRRKGTTTYQEVADELVEEARRLSDHSAARGEAVPADETDEKNIRRRVYDALNVLKALGSIECDRDSRERQIVWKGFHFPDAAGFSRAPPPPALDDALVDEVQQKEAYLMDLVDQYTALCNLLKRNAEGCQGPDADPIALPFIIAKTSPHAVVDVAISANEHQGSFDFNQSAFQIHDDVFVLKSMGLCDKRPGTEPALSARRSARSKQGSNRRGAAVHA